MNGFDPRHIVLLVDDSPETLTMLTEALEEAGLTVLVARDGQTALGLLDRIDPDLILMDAVMPGLSGFDTCRQIKASVRFAATPVVFMTGLGRSADIVHGLGVGGVDYVTKPVDPEQLIARISVHIANARILKEAREALDVSGRGVMALNDRGGIYWLSPRAAEFAAALASDVVRLAIADWIGQSAHRSLFEMRPLEIAEQADYPAVELAYLARTENGGHLVRLAPASGEPPDQRLSRSLSLTAREGEVLRWLAEGKSNRDIATILEISPRTINKHLEQIYGKIGVENRTAAVSVALRHLEH